MNKKCSISVIEHIYQIYDGLDKESTALRDCYFLVYMILGLSPKSDLSIYLSIYKTSQNYLYTLKKIFISYPESVILMKRCFIY